MYVCMYVLFRRGWHSSFNKWLVRYIYMPMGGRSARYVSVWLIFLFVALLVVCIISYLVVCSGVLTLHCSFRYDLEPKLLVERVFLCVGSVG